MNKPIHNNNRRLNRNKTHILKTYNISKLNNVVSNLPIVGVGDSVMLGAISNLQSQFPNGYFDAKVSRTAWKVAPILKDLTEKNMLGNPYS